MNHLLGLILSLLLASPVALFAGTSCNDFWGMDETCITVHPELNLGTIDSATFQDPTPQGGGFFAVLESLGNGVTVVRTSTFAMTWLLEVQVVSASPLVDLSRFSWRGGDQTSYTTFPAVGVWMRVASGRSIDSTDTFSIDYRYQPTVNDPPGDYALTLRYRVSLFWWFLVNPVYSVHHDVSLSWNALTWLVLAVHDPVDLGTIDSAIFDIDHGFSSLESFGNQVFVISNSPNGWEVVLGVASTSAPPGFQGDLLADLYWRIDEGTYHSAIGLDMAPVLVASRPAAGSAVLTFDFRYQVDTDDIPGAYTVTLRYTATAR